MKNLREQEWRERNPEQWRVREQRIQQRRLERNPMN